MLKCLLYTELFSSCVIVTLLRLQTVLHRLELTHTKLCSRDIENIGIRPVQKLPADSEGERTKIEGRGPNVSE